MDIFDTLLTIIHAIFRAWFLYAFSQDLCKCSFQQMSHSPGETSKDWAQCFGEWLPNAYFSEPCPQYITKTWILNGCDHEDRPPQYPHYDSQFTQHLIKISINCTRLITTMICYISRNHHSRFIRHWAGRIEIILTGCSTTAFWSIRFLCIL